MISCNEELIKRGVVDWDEQLEKLREMKGYQWLVKEIDTTVETGEKAGKRYEEELRVWREKVKDLEESEGTIVKKDGGEEKEEGENRPLIDPHPQKSNRSLCPPLRSPRCAHRGGEDHPTTTGSPISPPSIPLEPLHRDPNLP